MSFVLNIYNVVSRHIMLSCGKAFAEVKNLLGTCLMLNLKLL